MLIAIGCDHAGLGLKDEISERLAQLGAAITDFGINPGESCDYPVMAEQVAAAVKNGSFDGGVLICGTGIGMCMAANKVRGIRAANCGEPFSARMAKEHNNANILCLGARVIGAEAAKETAAAWLLAEFQGGRHEKRIGMFEEIEKRYQ